MCRVQSVFSILEIIMFEQMKVFVAVVDAGGLAAAARLLGISAASVTRAVTGLEAHLGVRLLHRSARHLRLTDVGERFLCDARRILDEWREAEAVARNAHVEPQGALMVTAPLTFGRLHVAPVLQEFLAVYPKVQAHLVLADRVMPLVDEGFDVALRIATLSDSSLTAVRVGAVRTVVVASPNYLAARGEPLTPLDLPQHCAIGLIHLGGGPRHWFFASSGADALPQLSFWVNTADVAIDAALAGRGLARLLSYQVHAHVEAGRLKRVLRAHEPPPIPVQLVYPAGRKASAKVRAFVDFAARRLRTHPALGEG